MGSIIQLLIMAAALAGLWKSFEKMGRKGWEGIVPFYNVYILSQVMGKEIVWLIMCFIPLVNIVPMIDVAKAWGKGTGFGIGLALVPFICWPILGFSSASFQGAGAATPTA
jgi:hypothetical protein